MKEKILAALRTAYANAGLGDKVLDGVAEAVAQTVTEEGQITQAINAPWVSNHIKAIQGDADRLRTEIATLKKAQGQQQQAEAPKEPEKPETVPQPDTTTTTIDLQKQLEELRQGLETLRGQQAARVAAESKKATVDGARDILTKSGLTSTPILNMVLREAQVGADETAQQLADRLRGDYDARFKEFYGEGIRPPFGGGPAPQQDTKRTDAAFRDRMIAEGKLPKRTD